MATAYIVAKVEDVPAGTHLVAEVAGREVGVFNIEGIYYALPNVCLHQSGPLCRGAVSGTVIANAETGWQREWVNDGQIVVCPWHALEFNITTGQCLAFPQRRLRTYPVRVEGNQIIVDI